jgi:uncharacterized protein (TIGR02118 family)
MQRIVVYLKRRADLAQPAFFDWWLGQHRQLAEQLPGLRRYIISLAADAPEGRFDGMAELWYEDLAAADDAFASAAGQAALADSDAHISRRERLNLTEHTIIDHPTPPRFKFAAGLKRRADMSREEFGQWWLELKLSSTALPRCGSTIWTRCGVSPRVRRCRRHRSTRLPTRATVSAYSSKSIASVSL